jgi:hypothetical protein
VVVTAESRLIESPLPANDPLADLLRRNAATIRPAFSAPRASGSRPEPRATTALQAFYRVEAHPERLGDLAADLRAHDSVISTFLKPPVYPAQFMNANLLPLADPAPPMTPDFTTRQGYLDAAPEGVDARYAWGVPGGGGSDIRIIDIEGAWQFTHEDLNDNQSGLAGGSALDDIHWRNHGTAVLGVFSGDRNGVGITGIAPDASVRVISRFGIGTAQAIHLAAELLSPGDILLIELHQPGPRFNFDDRPDQRGFIPVEWWPDVQAAIRFAVAKGVVVVEAAGNGAEDLDAPLYDAKPAPPFGPFPPDWRNPFRRGSADTGAILVGAGAPPVGTHGHDSGPDRSRLDFSNFGAAVDAQGWGREVTTAGYGTLQGGDSEDLWYTDEFAGTSSASPIVVGALACLQGALRAAGKVQLAPGGARDVLRRVGSPQLARPGQTGVENIGHRPDLRALFLALL